jgi:hypothetical protein
VAVRREFGLGGSDRARGKSRFSGQQERSNITADLGGEQAKTRVLTLHRIFLGPNILFRYRRRCHTRNRWMGVADDDLVTGLSKNTTEGWMDVVWNLTRRLAPRWRKSRRPSITPNHICELWVGVHIYCIGANYSSK